MDVKRKYLDGDPPSGTACSDFCDLMTHVDTYNGVNDSHAGKDDLLYDLVMDKVSERPVKHAECLEAVEKYSLEGPLAQPTRNLFNDLELKMGKRRINLFRKISQDEPKLKDVGKSKIDETYRENSQKRDESDRRAEGSTGCLGLSTSMTGTSMSSFESWLCPWSYGHLEQYTKVAHLPEPLLLRRLGHRGSVLHIGKNRRRKKRK